MRIKGNSLVSGFFLLIGLFGIIASANFHYWESMTLPLITSSLVLILAAVQLVRDLRQRAPEKEDSEKKNEIKRGLIIFGWSAGFVLATYLFGFYLSIPFFSFAYLKLHSRGWITSVVFAIIFVAFVYVVFEIVLKTPMYKGWIFSLF